MQKFFAWSAVIAIKTCIVYVAIVYGLGIQPRSWLVICAAWLASATLAEMFLMMRDEEKRR